MPENGVFIGPSSQGVYLVVEERPASKAERGNLADFCSAYSSLRPDVNVSNSLVSNIVLHARKLVLPLSVTSQFFPQG